MNFVEMDASSGTGKVLRCQFLLGGNLRVGDGAPRTPYSQPLLQHSLPLHSTDSFSPKLLTFVRNRIIITLVFWSLRSSYMPDGPAPAQQFLRGPLKYDVDSPSPQLEGGRLFSVYVRVTNPYESPVSLLSVSVSLPAEFRDEANINTGFWRTAKAQFRQEITNRIVLADNVLPSTNESAQ